jgi:hypothetical protein
MLTPSIAPDIQQNLAITAYLLFSHNYIAFVYLGGLAISILLSILRPSRFSVLILLGFLILLFSFEYDKHLIVPFRNQTLKSLITEIPHYKLQKVINLIISEILPIFFYTLGWGFIYLAIIIEGLKKSKKHENN